MTADSPRFNRRQSLGLFAGLVALAAHPDVVGASGGTSGTSRSTRRPGTSTAARARASSPANPDATLRYGAANLVTRFDPHRSSSGYDQNWLAPVYERLIWQTPEVELEPGLATEWGFVDDQTFEMTLREGVTFTDGAPFDADAVKANIERAKTIEGSGVVAYLASVETVEVIDASHVRFVLNKPDATLPMQLATRPGMMMSPTFMEDPDVDRAAVGTGPFILTEYRDGERALFERNPDHWNPDYAQLGGLEIIYLPDQTTRLNALRSGQIDACTIGVEQIDQVQSMPEFNTEVYDTIETYHFQPDRTKAEFGNPLVRKAMSHAINREAIVEGLMFGYATAATSWVAPGTPYFVEDLGESTTYDVERARELMAEAGLPDGFSFTAGCSVQPIYVQLSEVLQQSFAEIGIEMTVQQEPNLADAFFVQNAIDAIVSPYPGRIDPTETAQIYFNDESFSNPGRQIDPEVAEAYDRAMIPGDDREAAIEALVRAIDESMPNIPILYPKLGVAAVTAVEGLTWYRSGHIEFAGVTMAG